jgi:hypothetical protein
MQVEAAVDASNASLHEARAAAEKQELVHQRMVLDKEDAIKLVQHELQHVLQVSAPAFAFT